MRDIFDLGFTEAFGMKIYEQPVKIVPILKAWLWCSATSL
jgi:hypothetical protein